MIKLKVLGSFASLSSKRGKHFSLLFDIDGKLLWLDPAVKLDKPVDGIIISQSSDDHYKYLDTYLKKFRDTPVYSLGAILSKINTKYKSNLIAPKSALKFNGAKIVFIKVPEAVGVPATGIKIEKGNTEISILPEFSRLSKQAIEYIKNTVVIAGVGNYDKPKPNDHKITLKDFIVYLDKIKPKRLYLINFRDDLLKHRAEVINDLKKFNGKLLFDGSELIFKSLEKKSSIKPGYYSKAKPVYRGYFEQLKDNLSSIKWNDKKLLVDTKWDGLRMTIGKSNGKGWAYVDPENLKEKSPNISSRIPAIIKEIENNFPDNTILDGEFLAIHPNGKEMLHRTVSNSLLNSKVSGDELEQYAIIVIFDVLFFDGLDIRKQPLHERLEYLGRLKSTKHIWIEKISNKFPDKADGFIVRGKDINKIERIIDFLQQARNGRPKFCAEGVMIKRLDWPYEYPQNHGWMKAKFWHELDLRVLDKKLVKGAKSTYNYFLGYDTPVEYARAYLQNSTKDWYGKVRVIKDGKVIATGKECIKYFDNKNVKFVTFMGKTDNTNVNADINDIIRIAAEEVLRFENPKNEKYPRYSFYIGRVLEQIPEKNVTDSISVIEKLSEFEPKRIPIDELRHITENPIDKTQVHDFVLHLHIPDKNINMNPHFDLRWKLSGTSKEETAIYKNPLTLKVGEKAKARHKVIHHETPESLKKWMICSDDLEPRYVRGVGKTYIYCLDSGKLRVLSHTDDEIILDINGKKLKGRYILSRTEGGWLFSKYDKTINKSNIKNEELKQWVENGKIPKEIYNDIAKPNQPLDKSFYINYDEANFAWAQMHIRGLEPEDVKKYKNKKISFEELITGHSIHVDWRMKFKNSFVQWVITQDHIKDYFDTLIGRRDTKTGNVSKGLAIVKPSAEEPKKVIKNKKELIISKEDAKLIKKYVLLDKSYLIPPGDVGATAYKWAYMCTIWIGSVKAGMQREDAHEYFSYPANNLPNINKELFNGRFIIRAFKAGKDKRWWVWKAIDNPKPMDPIYHSCTGYYWPIPASQIQKFGRESYREESKKLYLKMIT